MSSITGYYVPGAKNNSYVSNQRNEEGSFIYDRGYNEINAGSTKALANLNDTYSSTINDAYGSYLSSKRSISNSLMGEGYKEAYLQAQQNAMTANLAETNNTFSSVRSEIEQGAQESKNMLNAAYEKEVYNYDKAQSYLSQYYDYLKGLTTNDGENPSSYLGSLDVTKDMSEEQLNGLGLEYLYSDVLNAAPVGYLDAEGKEGLGFNQWLNSQVDIDDENDATWWRWYSSGGSKNFYDLALKSQKAIKLPTKDKTVVEAGMSPEEFAKTAKASPIDVLSVGGRHLKTDILNFRDEVKKWLDKLF